MRYIFEGNDHKTPMCTKIALWNTFIELWKIKIPARKGVKRDANESAFLVSMKLYKIRAMIRTWTTP